jgi:hypothetical protein
MRALSPQEEGGFLIFARRKSRGPLPPSFFGSFKVQATKSKYAKRLSFLRAGRLGCEIKELNCRAGIVSVERSADQERGRTSVAERQVWRHADEQPTRDAAVRRLGEMLEGLYRRAPRRAIILLPASVLRARGGLDRTAGLSAARKTYRVIGRRKISILPRILQDILLRHCDWNALLIMHNDAIVQGLSQVPFMKDIKHWGVLTISAGVGNARFTNR